MIIHDIPTTYKAYVRHELQVFFCPKVPWLSMLRYLKYRPLWAARSKLRKQGIHLPDSAIRAQPIVEAAVEALTPACGCKIATRLVGWGVSAASTMSGFSMGLSMGL